jgi:hypothetical protein
LAEIETRWANLRAGPKTLTEIEAHRMAAMVHGRWLQHHQDNPSNQTSWRTTLLIGRSLLPKLSRWVTFAAESF